MEKAFKGDYHWEYYLKLSWDSQGVHQSFMIGFHGSFESCRGAIVGLVSQAFFFPVAKMTLKTQKFWGKSDIFAEDFGRIL